jgi:hypothetical protein
MSCVQHNEHHANKCVKEDNMLNQYESIAPRKIVIRSTNDVPNIFHEIPWIRHAQWVRWGDCEEDLFLIERMKSVCSGLNDLSVFDSTFDFIIKAEFPGDWGSYMGRTDRSIVWSYCYWKIKDLFHYLDGNSAPVESVHVDKIEISQIQSDLIYSSKSVIPMLKQYSKLTKSESSFDRYFDQIRMIEARIKTLQVGNKSKSVKTKALPPSLNSSKVRLISPAVRTRILDRDGYRCILCGANSDSSRFHIDHIIPVSIICKLHLAEELLVSGLNLCVKCENCNHGKSDNLFPNMVVEYMNRFMPPDHPNHKLMPLLLAIHDMQKSDITLYE